MTTYVPNYDKFPVVHVKQQDVICGEGWEQVGNIINDRIQLISNTKKIIAIECYTGIDDEEVLTNLQILHQRRIHSYKRLHVA